MGRPSPLLPRSATFPTLFVRTPSGSPRAPIRSKGSNELSRNNDGGRGNGLLRMLGSQSFVTAAAALYLLLAVCAPLLFLSTRGGDPAAVAVAPADNRAEIIEALPQRSAATLRQGNRRMALQQLRQQRLRRGEAAALQPGGATDSSHQSGRGGSAPALIEYKSPGRKELVEDALTRQEPPVYTTEAAVRQQVDAAERPSTDSSSSQPSWCPQGPIRVFVGITSRCCNTGARAKRDAQRRTWLRTVADQYPQQIAASFFLAQPDGATQLAQAAPLLRDEAELHDDIVIVPGAERYRNLPSKTLHLLNYALASPCAFTHVLKTDDDVFLRPKQLLEMIASGEHQLELEVQYNGSTRGDVGDAGGGGAGAARAEAEVEGGAELEGRAPITLQAPWLRGMYVGKVDNNRTGSFPGWAPDRDSSHKWYLSESDLPDEAAPWGVRWISGWGYALSRDVAELVAGKAAEYAAASGAEALQRRPGWWGRLPWEDAMVAALLNSTGVAVSQHPGFKAAWDGCGPDSVLKHLDNDAPALTAGLAVQDASGLWSRKAVECSSGVFTPGNVTEWRAWRNSLPDNRKNGFM